MRGSRRNASTASGRHPAHSECLSAPTPASERRLAPRLHTLILVRYAFKTANQHTTWADLLATWREADQIDVFESGWVFDHLYPIQTPDEPAKITGPCLEGWSLLAALAQATHRLRLGCLVTGTHFRHPALLAKMAATVDIVSDGRLEIGLGGGWNSTETDAYGIELLPLRQRFDRFDEYCHVLTSLLENETTDFHGRYFSVSHGLLCRRRFNARDHRS